MYQIYSIESIVGETIRNAMWLGDGRLALICESGAFLVIGADWNRDRCGDVSAYVEVDYHVAEKARLMEIGAISEEEYLEHIAQVEKEKAEKAEREKRERDAQKIRELEKRAAELGMTIVRE